ncbi:MULTISPECIES: hypothetical protein [unclassified Rhizobium]|uniref:hypothetical protein n=1 Tax=unclassified Rhizobium TaxID=2613769 RepID=UPI0006FC10D9|nr:MULTISPECIES: hypothetical protein [unclassified Rhizobium]KQV38514.1 hypothetical protein ASC86_09940 [Rhizobium sp. Root1212]KRD31167.1 hypothetical protein ASE37_09935 [Rhizobium sp. Root268]
MIATANNWENVDFDYRAWIADGRVKIIGPPYDVNFEVTPGTFFAKNVWPFPISSLPAGSRVKPELDFETPRYISEKEKLALSPSRHFFLIQQLKEVVVAMMFLRHLLPHRKDAAKPLTIIRDFQRISCLFTNFAAEGITSLKQVNQTLLDNVFAKIPVTESSHEALIGHFSDMVLLSSKKLISDSFALPSASIKSRRVAVDTESARGARTLEEDEIAFIIARSRLYIDSASLISEKLLERRNGAISSTKLVEWSYNNLPVLRGLSSSSIEYQLTWLVKSSAYNLLIFHLGSRVSEGLSLTKNSIFATKDATGRYNAFVRLTIFKGTKAGAPRTYRVHPYLLRVDAALKAIATATGRSSDELVFSKRGQDLEVATNSLNYQLRKFTEMHGQLIDLSSHSERFTLADIVASAVKNPFPALQYQLGHKYVGESIAYGLHGPAGAEIRSAGVAAIADGISSFIEECQNASEIGGIRGATISYALKIDTDAEGLKEQMLSTGTFPLKVGDDRYCVKPDFARGACSSVTGDDIHEIEFCTADCRFQTQFPSQRAKWESFIDQGAQYYGDHSISVHEKIRTSDELLKHLVAWPSLREPFDKFLSENPTLRSWFS